MPIFIQRSKYESGVSMKENSMKKPAYSRRVNSMAYVNLPTRTWQAW